MGLFVLSVSLVMASAVSGTEHPSGAIHNRERWIDLDPLYGGGPLRPAPPVSNSWQDPSAEIFVTIPNYRDGACGDTLKALFTQAAHPDRVFVGLVQQRKEDDPDCIERYCTLMGSNLNNCPHMLQIRSMLMSVQEARGPVFARSYHEVLVQDEEFCLQIDSHVAVLKDWDVLLTQMWGQTHNEYGVLSTSPPDVSEMGTPKALGQLQQVPHLCHHYLSDVGIIRNARATSAILKSPILAASWSAGFSFAKCHLDAKVPYDPNLPSITEGEDFTRYARMWTFGYDVYTPPVSVVFHDYHSADSKPYDPTEWTEMGMNKDFIRQEQDAAIRRMRMLIGAHAADADFEADQSLAEAVQALGRYGLGTKRTLDQFIDFTGVDTRTGIVFKDSCKQLGWVPYPIDASPWLSETDAWGLSPERTSESLFPPTYKPLSPDQIRSRALNTEDVIEARDQKLGHIVYSEVGELRRFILWFASFADSMVDYLRAPFVERLGQSQGQKAFIIFLSTIPLFMGLLFLSFFVLLPEEVEQDRGGGASQVMRSKPKHYVDKSEAKSPIFDRSEDGSKHL